MPSEHKICLQTAFPPPVAVQSTISSLGDPHRENPHFRQRTGRFYRRTNPCRHTQQRRNRYRHRRKSIAGNRQPPRCPNRFRQRRIPLHIRTRRRGRCRLAARALPQRRNQHRRLQSCRRPVQHPRPHRARPFQRIPRIPQPQARKQRKRQPFHIRHNRNHQPRTARYRTACRPDRLPGRIAGFTFCRRPRADGHHTGAARRTACRTQHCRHRPRFARRGRLPNLRRLPQQPPHRPRAANRHHRRRRNPVCRRRRKHRRGHTRIAPQKNPAPAAS
ncbi:Uncharacterised protein [Neisseria meningitidis]|nr:Uncharacterised protein [Neisseria meningitidis]